MAFWIFKVSDQELYHDRSGQTYVFDNTHSTRVTAGDAFLYLDKRGGRYRFTGHGIVKRVNTRKPVVREVRHSRVRLIYEAQLTDVIEWDPPLDLRVSSAVGKRHRFLLGISDVNKLGWSASIAKLDERMYDRILSLAYAGGLVLTPSAMPETYEIPDAWSVVRKRHALEVFRFAVLERQGFMCAICGTKVREVLEVAHLSPYATDRNNRANPANGIGLCAYCHRAFDSGVISISHDGMVAARGPTASDPVVQCHVNGLPKDIRSQLLAAIDWSLMTDSKASVLDGSN